MKLIMIFLILDMWETTGYAIHDFPNLMKCLEDSGKVLLKMKTQTNLRESIHIWFSKHNKMSPRAEKVSLKFKNQIDLPQFTP